MWACWFDTGPLPSGALAHNPLICSVSSMGFWLYFKSTQPTMFDSAALLFPWHQFSEQDCSVHCTYLIGVHKVKTRSIKDALHKWHTCNDEHLFMSSGAPKGKKKKKRKKTLPASWKLQAGFSFFQLWRFWKFQMTLWVIQTYLLRKVCFGVVFHGNKLGKWGMA